MRRRDLLIAGLSLPIAVESRAAAPMAVLELFTSQGCSSCPPADAYLGELSRQPNTIALAWHVDYWNNLGWRDPFASAQSTARQRAYAMQLRDEVYTPALVVNGAKIVVGSDRSAVTRAIATTTPPTLLPLRRTSAGLETMASDVPAGASALVAYYDAEVATPIAAGENAGRRLTEYRIVRETREVAVTGGPIVMPAARPGQGAALLIRDARWRIVAAGDSRPG
jgi:hypothetical protein